MLLSVKPVEDDLNVHKLQLKFLHDGTEKVTKFYVLPTALLMKAVLKISCIPNAAFRNLKQNII
jgi:hypothetical protein